MTLKASAAVVSSVAISTMGLISSRTGVVLASRPLRANLARTSRSVNIPATIPCSSMIATAPTSLSNIVLTASCTLASAETMAGPSSHHSRRLITGSGSFSLRLRGYVALRGESRGMQWRSVSTSRVRGNHGDVEVHHFFSAGVANAGQIDVSALGGVADVRNIEKQEARLGRVGLDGKGAEFGAVDL